MRRCPPPWLSTPAQPFKTSGERTCLFIVVPETYRTWFFFWCFHPVCVNFCLLFFSNFPSHEKKMDRESSRVRTVENYVPGVVCWYHVHGEGAWGMPGPPPPQSVLDHMTTENNVVIPKMKRVMRIYPCPMHRSLPVYCESTSTPQH